MGDASTPAAVGRRALFGLETETSVVPDEDRVAARAGTYHQPRAETTAGELTRLLFKPLIAVYRSGNAFMRNGARLYLDVGSHPEYATPEVGSLYDLVVVTKAGEEFLGRLPEVATRFRPETLGFGGQQLLGMPGAPRAGIFATNRDSAGNGMGCHENYLLRRAQWPDSGFFAHLRSNVVPFLMSRQMICGAGHWEVTSRGHTYHVSQRWDHFVKDEANSSTTRERGILNTKDEPHGDGEHFRRLHVINGDTNRSEYSTWLKVGSMQLVLDMVADGVDFSGLELAAPTAALRTWSADPECREVIPLKNPHLARRQGFGDYLTGDGITADAMQRAYLDRATAHFIDGNRPSGLSRAETEQTIGMWQHVVDALSTHDMKQIVGQIGTQVDWAIKYKLIEGYRVKNDLPATHSRLQLIDIDYHRLGDNTIFARLETGGRSGRPQVERLVDHADVMAAVDRAPEGTRARLRGDWVARMQELGYNTQSTEWQTLAATPAGERPGGGPWPDMPAVARTTEAQATATFICRDPFATEDARVAAVYRTLGIDPASTPVPDRIVAAPTATVTGTSAPVRDEATAGVDALRRAATAPPVAHHPGAHPGRTAPPVVESAVTHTPADGIPQSDPASPAAGGDRRVTRDPAPTPAPATRPAAGADAPSTTTHQPHTPPQPGSPPGGADFGL